MQEVRITYLNPRDLLPSRHNVRSDPGDLAGLAETIREHGILQPLGVQREADAYRVVYGNRRRDAAIVVGLDRVPCIVLDSLNEEDIVVRQVLENLQRLDLNDMDKARAFEQLLERADDGRTRTDIMEEMARTLGLSSRQIQRYLRLTQLPPQVQQLIVQGELGVTHGQHLVDIKPEERQEQLALLTVEESLSAAELSRLCAALQHNANIDPDTALAMMRRGERVPVVEAQVREGLPRLSHAPAPNPGGDLPPWDLGDEEDEDETEETPEPRFGGQAPAGSAASSEGFDYLQPATRDGNRVRKIHSLDEFMDQLQRMTQCLQEGDFQRLMGDDEAGALKTRFAARQLRFLADAVTALAHASGIVDEE